MGPRHAVPVTEPALVVSAFLDPLQEDRRAPVVSQDLSGNAGNGVPCPVQAGFHRGRGWNGVSAMVACVAVPHLFACIEVFRNAGLEVGERCQRHEGSARFRCLAGELISPLVPGNSRMALHPLDLYGPFGGK